ncbi:MAG: sulfite exporter TauE/SafE family protein [Gammaproteobacteria bacterium]|nr:sulfite exporter TauE/SafE family protein [Gammaproteobacteria bacterium]
MTVEFITSPYFIALLFFLIAFVYSSVGLGGGSSYTALMTILGFSTLVIPMVSLTLNLMVTAIGSINYIRHKHARWNLILPFLITSIPMAYLGGSLQLDKQTFYWVLLISLCFVAARIYLWSSTSLQLNLSARSKLVLALFTGSILGLVAGVAGIGGGIYLVPLIIILGLGTQKEAAAAGVIFIFINSLAGLIARLQYNMIDFGEYVPMIIAVALGGILGSHLGAVRYSPKTMERLLGGLVILAIILIGRKLIL